MARGTHNETLTSALHGTGSEQTGFILDTVRCCEITDLAAARIRTFDAPRADGPALPPVVGECRGTDPATLCLGPREWLAVSASLTGGQLLNHLESTVEAGLGAVYDVGDSLTAFRLSGSGAAWLLAKASGLDFLGGQRGRPHGARTRLAGVSAIIHHHQAADGEWVFDVLADRDVSAWLGARLSNLAPHADELAKNFGAAK